MKMNSLKDPITVVIPAYNEEHSVGSVLERVERVLNKAQIPHEMILVDDGSTDQTSSIAQSSGARVIRHERNRGYGAALKTGIKTARNELIVIIDGDSTYPVDPIKEIVDNLKNADMVIGSRVSKSINIPFFRRPAKWILQRLAEYITGDRIPDLNSGLRAFRRQLVWKYLDILPDRFSFTTTLTVAMVCENYKIAYIPIDYNKRLGKSKVVPWDFVSFVTLVLRLSMLFNPLKIFVPVAFTCFFLGGCKFTLDIVLSILRAEKVTFLILALPMVSTTTVILLLSGLQILLIGMMSDGIARKIGQRMSPQYNSLTKNLDISQPESDASTTAHTNHEKKSA